MKTTSNRILVTEVKSEEKKVNDLGLTLPDEFKLQGLKKVKVEYSGDEIKDVKPGDTLVIYDGSGTKFKEGEKEYLVISVTDIVIIYE